VVIPEGGAEGVLVCCGGLGGGFTLFMKNGRLHWEHNYYNEQRYRVSSTEKIPAGRHILSADVAVDEQGSFQTGGLVTLRQGEATIGEGRFDKQIGGFFTANESFDVGCDTCSPVSDQYETPFSFSGTIVRVVVDVSEATFEQLAAQREAHARLARVTQ
jgi:arylsulfatase